MHTNRHRRKFAVFGDTEPTSIANPTKTRIPPTRDHSPQLKELVVTQKIRQPSFKPASSGECRDKPESRWHQIDAKRTPSDARAAFSEEICEIADFPAGCTGIASEVYRYAILAERVLLSGKRKLGFVADVAPQSRSGILPSSCCYEQAGRAEVFAVFLSQRCPVLSRSIGLRRDLVRWIRTARGIHEALTCEFCWSLIELDRDTLHTRLGSAHECHSGVRLVLLRWCRSCQLDLLSTDQLEWIEPDSRNGAGTGVFTVRGRVCLQSRLDWSDLTFLQLVSVEHDSVVDDSGRVCFLLSFYPCSLL
uniref:Uncharacterized protein n=1 Tax=Ananas comosus var. bracteatus TaxID=296719 RepID=A0A6V7PL14_ANACO|nr:unnamed protein product [Ananas comosus var. bracteatus]